MVGPAEILLLVLIVLYLGFVAWSFRYVIRKADEIRKINPYALVVWQVVVIHIFIIVIVNSIGIYLFPHVLKLFAHPISCIILPIYLKLKYKSVYRIENKE